MEYFAQALRSLVRYHKVALLSLVLFIGAAASVLVSPSAYALPAGFTKVQLAGSSSLTNPVTFRFAANGDIFIGEQAGAIKILRNGAVLPTPVITLNAESVGEQGLLGIE